MNETPISEHTMPTGSVEGPEELIILGTGTQNQIYTDPDSGDLMVRQISGPNAGKSVNLTYGRWL